MIITHVYMQKDIHTLRIWGSDKPANNVIIIIGSSNGSYVSWSLDRNNLVLAFVFSRREILTKNVKHSVMKAEKLQPKSETK